MIRAQILAVVLAFFLANAPIRDWTCPACGTVQEEGRARCMNGCGTNGPLAVPQPDGDD